MWSAVPCRHRSCQKYYRNRNFCQKAKIIFFLLHDIIIFKKIKNYTYVTLSSQFALFTLYTLYPQSPWFPFSWKPALIFLFNTRSEFSIILFSPEDIKLFTDNFCVFMIIPFLVPCQFQKLLFYCLDFIESVLLPIHFDMLSGLPYVGIFLECAYKCVPTG